MELGHLADHEAEASSAARAVGPALRSADVVTGDRQLLGERGQWRMPRSACRPGLLPVERGHVNVDPSVYVALGRGLVDAFERVVRQMVLREQRQVGDVGDEAARGEALGDECLRPGQGVTVEVHRAIEVEEVRC